ncbi:hypothetical protein AGMMS49944_20550 [Spirochaetia bacterium]|nr:hypothetical protein AGMMS49944_20550 [Spirochaetia bacterium]
MPKAPNTTIQNSGHLCSVYCPECKKVIGKISFNLLREAGAVEVACSGCGSTISFEYDGKVARVSNDCRYI